MAWTAPADWTTGELVTAAKMATHVKDNLAYLKTSADKADLIYTVTQADVTASRAVDGTVYQNTSGKIIIATVAIALTCATTQYEGVVFYCGTANPPTVAKGSVYLTQIGATSIREDGTVTFIVPVNYYYKATASGTGTAGKLSWIEDTLF